MINATVTVSKVTIKNYKIWRTIMKRIISMILILTFITSTMALVSCTIRQEAGNGSNNTDVTTKNENGDDPTALPKMDFDESWAI